MNTYYYQLGSLNMGKIVKISLNPPMEVEGNLIDMSLEHYILSNGKRKKDRERESWLNSVSVSVNSI